jgi:hypothetical protein
MESNKPKLTFVKKPQLIPHLRRQNQVSIVCNQLLLRLRQNGDCIQQYHFVITPQIEEERIKERKELFRELRKSMLQVYGKKFYITGNSLFALKSIEASHEFTNNVHKVKINKTRNSINLSNINTMSDDDQELKRHLGVVVKSILRENENLVNFRNQYFDYRQKTNLTGNSFNS